MWENRGLDSPGSSWVVLKLLRFKLMNRFPFVPAQLLSIALQPLSQAGSKHYSDKTKHSFSFALPPRLLRNNIYKIAIKMGGDSKTTSVQVKLPVYKIPGTKSALQHKFPPTHLFTCFKASLVAGPHPACSPGPLSHASPNTGVGGLLYGSLLVHLGPCTSIWTDPTSLQSREAQPLCSKLSRAKREPETEVTAEPQVITTTGLWQPQVGTICASSRAQESIFLHSLWQEPFPTLWSRAGRKAQSRAESFSSSWCSPCLEVSRAQQCAVGSKRAFTHSLGEQRGLQQRTWQHHRPRNRNERL